MAYLDYEKLDVYRVAMKLALLVDKTTEGIPSYRAYLIDQMRRSSASVVLNIAEGAGEHSPAEKHRFYRMAKRSATECASTVELCWHLKLVGEEQYLLVRSQVIRVVAMLTRLFQAKALPVP